MFRPVSRSLRALSLGKAGTKIKPPSPKRVSPKSKSSDRTPADRVGFHPPSPTSTPRVVKNFLKNLQDAYYTVRKPSYFQKPKEVVEIADDCDDWLLALEGMTLTKRSRRTLSQQERRIEIVVRDPCWNNLRSFASLLLYI
eukprot:TRINITY_DN3474_c0_g1_i1.p1 TRINITY_DN3474_c0_g1~~TRINITY_DN3474_c0_g1_i1.p1  ORF type:complete len:153 (-),score=5.98 TRINITY_DN3474_c0_g1_i1:87-509(-)